MVSYRYIQASNSQINDATAPHVAVFVGGTSGIGKFTIKALVATGLGVRIYLVGRKSSEERMHAFTRKLNAMNSKAEIIWIEGEVSLRAETKRVCEVIKSKESRVDLLFLSTGYAPFGTRKETSEGLEIAQKLEYYSRILFTIHLLPILGQAEAAKVASVLGGGLERATVDLDDLDMKKPGNFGAIKAQTQYIAMNTMALEKIANENPKVSFIHSWPGFVNTGNVKRSDPNPLMAWFIRLFLESLIIRLIALSDEGSGQRNLFQSTSATLGGRGVPWKGKPGINSLEKHGDGLFPVNSIVTVASRGIGRAIERFGKVDILVLNAGLLVADNSLDKTEEADYGRAFGTNVKGVMFLVKVCT
ncbi:hypothetical protein FQN50_001919 [Emmonsiellopsis sp. PD_5]|nr:hypothetical protein FQN50_001919 [Emmonsiellopsis sp. PD_5]